VLQPLTASIQIGPAQLASIARRTAGRPAPWIGHIRFDPARRWYHRLVLADRYEVWLLTWLPGQQTGFHDHGRSAGAFAVAVGSLRERSAAAGRVDLCDRAVTQGAARSFGPAYVHDVRNDTTEPAVSIHAYSPPLSSMRRFDVTSDGTLRAAGEERSW